MKYWGWKCDKYFLKYRSKQGRVSSFDATSANLAIHSSEMFGFLWIEQDSKRENYWRTLREKCSRCFIFGRPWTKAIISRSVIWQLEKKGKEKATKCHTWDTRIQAGEDLVKMRMQ